MERFGRSFDDLRAFIFLRFAVFRSPFFSYCYAQGAYKWLRLASYGNCWWWLRSPGYVSNYAAMVSHDGFVNNDGNILDFDLNAVRPALWINLRS